MKNFTCKRCLAQGGSKKVNNIQHWFNGLNVHMGCSQPQNSEISLTSQNFECQCCQELLTVLWTQPWTKETTWFLWSLLCVEGRQVNSIMRFLKRWWWLRRKAEGDLAGGAGQLQMGNTALRRGGPVRAEGASSGGVFRLRGGQCKGPEVGQHLVSWRERKKWGGWRCMGLRRVGFGFSSKGWGNGSEEEHWPDCILQRFTLAAVAETWRGIYRSVFFRKESLSFLPVHACFL